jgi:hypothetical protein
MLWILQFLPDELILLVCNTVLALGVVITLVASFLRAVPMINIYRLPLQMLGIALLVTGVYFRGGYAIEMEWRERVREMEAKVAAAEKKSAQTNTVIKRVYVDRVKKIRQTSVVYRDQIKEVEKVIDRDCRVPPEAIRILNDAARTPKATVEVGPLQKDEK